MFLYKAKRAALLLHSMLEDMEKENFPLDVRFDVHNFAMRLEKMVDRIERPEAHE